MFAAEEYAGRRARLTAALATQGIDLAVVTHQPDLFYLAGTCQAAYFFLDGAGESWLASRRGGPRARAETILPVEEFSNSEQLAAICRRRHLGRIRRLGLSYDVTRHDTLVRMGKLFPLADFVDLGPVLRDLRAVKSAAEIDLIRLAGRQLDGAFKTAASLLRQGQTELELAIRIEAYLRRKGHPGVMRTRRAISDAAFGFILAGPSTLAAAEADMICTGPGLSPAVPFGPSDREFRPGEPILFDYCGCCAGYMADQSRMLSIGPPPAEALWAYEAMRQVLRRVEKDLRPGVEAGRLFERAVREARILGYEDFFMGIGRSQLRFVGHGIGLELDEPPFLAQNRREILAPGMVAAVEPKVAMAGLGVIGVENTYLITADGYELLTPALEDWREVPMD